MSFFAILSRVEGKKKDVTAIVNATYKNETLLIKPKWETN